MGGDMKMSGFDDDTDELINSFLKELQEAEQEEAKDIRYLTEASCILQDYMNAWVLWNSNDDDFKDEDLYTNYLLRVVAKRADFVTSNIQ
jgi:hypothetical protein